MSNSAALRQTSPTRRRPVRAGNAARLRVVGEEQTLKKRSPLMAKIVAAALVLVALIVSPMLINTQLAVISYQIHDDQVELAQVQEDNQRVQSQVNLKSSPEKVRKAALDAGYVPAGETGYVTLKTSKIEGGTPPVPVAKE
ncbi:MAG: hypothetical protein E6X32_07200 [Varibaculum cambriense]|uniref:hypothetical protein n=1 Tax=Varibaculum cambriense TaxID=184870 RepID=UPI0029141AAD|nr:hypothetical protein [Varibaculum cambriense]MDU4945379.1 hypothetical protein [Varibaculum cambriense]